LIFRGKAEIGIKINVTQISENAIFFRFKLLLLQNLSCCSLISFLSPEFEERRGKKIFLPKIKELKSIGTYDQSYRAFL
jgi:hypothetical protein